jgi:hypothetical protein
VRRTSHNHLHIQEKTLIFPTIVKQSITSIVRTEMYSTVVEIVKELTQVHDVVAADGTIIHNNIPSPQSDSIPLLNFKPLGPLSNSGRTGTRTGTFTRRSRKNIHILRCHHFTLLPTSTLPPVSPNTRALPPVSIQPAKRKLAICYWNFSFSAGGWERGNRKQKENKKTKDFASPDAREELWTLILTRWVSFRFLQNSKTVRSFACNLNLLH